MKKKLASGMISTLLLVGLLALAFNIQHVRAEPGVISILHALGFTNIVESTAETFPPGTYEVKLYAEFAAYHPSNTLSWYVVGTSSFHLLFSGSEGNFGYVSPPIVKSFIAYEQLGLSFRSPEARYFTETARNPDGIRHALTYAVIDNPAMLLLGFENLYGGGDRDYQDMVISLELVKPAAVEATIDINPDTLNLKSKGEWITCYIELPEGYNVSDIDVSTVMLNATFAVSLLGVPPPEPIPTEIGDYNNNTIPDLMVKFNRAEVTSWVYNGLGIQYGNVTLAITGEQYDGTPFEGTCAIKALFPGDADDDGDVDFNDFTIFAGCYGMSVENPSCNPLADFDEDGHIKYDDFLILAGNYGKTAA